MIDALYQYANASKNVALNVELLSQECIDIVNLVIQERKHQEDRLKKFRELLGLDHEQIHHE